MDAATEQQSCLDAALGYAQRGWRVIPIVAGKKIPATPHGVKDATALADRIRSWYAKQPDNGLGVAGGGPARLVILDIDGDQGPTSLAGVELELGRLPETATVRTRNGGQHRYFTVPERYDIAAIKSRVGSLAPKLDIRGPGTYVVAPPTKGYAWTHDREPAPLPDRWCERLVDKSKATAWGNKAFDDEVSAVAGAPEGERNAQLNKSAFALGQIVAGGALSEHVVVESLVAAAIRAGLPESEARRTIASGIESGKREPRSAPQRAPESQPDSDSSWLSMLRYKRGGLALTNDPSNAVVLLSQHPDWQGRIGWDEFAGRAVWIGEPPQLIGPRPPKQGEPLADHHVTWVQFALAQTHGAQFSTSAVFDGLLAAAHDNAFHPLRDYLTGLQWDGEERVDGWLSNYLDADDSDYTSNIGRWWLISCVARVLRPGCQVDHMLVLESSKHGTGKTSACRILGGEYYLGSLPDFRDKKAAAETLAGRWIVEVGELDALRGSAATRVKDFLSQTIDHFRPAYGRMAVTRPRECVFVGTTNESQYLYDSTGARRFWPVRVGKLYRDDLENNRDQLWAEAVHLYRTGAQWWPDEQHAHDLDEAQESRFAVDDWEPVVADWCRAQTEFTSGDVLTHALKLDAAKWDRAAQTRVGAILHRLGYQAKQVRKNGARVRVYDGASKE